MCLRKVIRQKTVENVKIEPERKEDQNSIDNKVWLGPERETETIKT